MKELREGILNTLFLPYRFFHHELKVVGEKYVADDRAYLLDAKGQVHYFQYIGTNLHYGNPEEASDD